MAQVVVPASSARPLLYGAVGGLGAAAVALVVAGAAVGAQGRPPVAVANGVGAWFVRWLQTAAPSALDNFYLDATLGGLGIALGLGVVGGAALAGITGRLSEDSPLAWGLAAGFGFWLVAQWALVPALDPVLGRVLPSPGLALACLAYGLTLGWWLRAGRPVVGSGGWRGA